MFRLAGFLLIMTGSCGCGLSVVKAHADYLERCRAWQELLEMMENEITFRKSSLPELCGRLSVRLSGKRGIFLKRVGSAFQENNGETLGEVWKKEIMAVFQGETLKGELQKEVENLGEKLCYEDCEMQKKVLQEVRSMLKKHEEEQERLGRERNKLTLCAGIMGGLFIVVLLL